MEVPGQNSRAPRFRPAGKTGDSTRVRRRVKRLFEAVLELEETRRRAFLERELTQEPALREEVEALFGAYREADDFLETAALDSWARIWRAAEPGERLGPYEVLRMLGTGGMGMVFLAVRADDEYRKLVAVKLASRSSPRAVRERFRAERQILAGLEHPNIAHLLDGGTTGDGRPYLVMEYVDGERIDDYCDRHALAASQRIELFQRVCAAVRYAHHNLVVHRDLKPQNILITRGGEPKLLDFGIAKLLEEDGDVTRQGQRLLTPNSASPEQLRGLPVTTGTDVYALGVLLHRLLTGRLPRTFDSLHAPVIEEILARELPQPGLGRDLDTILIKALEVDPERRYASVEQLSEDLRRWAAGLPIQARANTWIYRASKFLRRHRLGVAASTAVLLLLVGFTVDKTGQAQALARERDRALLGETNARELSTFLVDLLRSSDPWREPGREVMVREVLDRGAEQVQSRFADQPELAARLLDTMGEIYVGLSRFDRANPLLEQALERRRQAFGDEHPAVADSLVKLGELRYLQGRYDEAEDLLTRAHDLRLQLFGSAHPAVGEVLYHFAEIAFLEGRYDESVALFRRALELRTKGLGEDHPDVADTRTQLAMVWVELRQLAAAEVLLRRALKSVDLHFGHTDPTAMVVRGHLASLLRSKGDLDGAEAMYREVLAARQAIFGDDHLQVGRAINNLAVVVAEKGELEEAESLYLQALEMGRRVYGETHLNVAVVHQSLGRVKLMQGDFDAAEPYLLRSLEITRQVLPPKHPGAAYGLLGLAEVELRRDRPQRAEPLLREALQLRQDALPPGHPEIVRTQRWLGDCLLRLGRTEEGEALLLAAGASREKEAQGRAPGRALRAPETPPENF